MKFHLPVNQGINTEMPKFTNRNGELVEPQNVYDNRQYPSLKNTLVKILGADGRSVFVPISKLKRVTTSEL